MGQPKKYLENFSASRVAEVTISFRSGLRLTASTKDRSSCSIVSWTKTYVLFINPNKTSVAIVLS